MADFRKLRVWHAAEQLAINVYRTTSRIRGARSATLADQLLRAAMSVPTNIVEGNAHSSSRERARYLGYSLASLWEVEGHVQLSSDLGMITKKDYDALLEQIVDVRKMLYGLLKKVRSWDTGRRKINPQ